MLKLDEQLEITKQPQEVSVKAGEIFNYSVEAKGIGIRYNWQYMKQGQTKWTSFSNSNTSTLSREMQSGWNNMKIRCIVTDSNNNQVVSDEVLLKLDEQLEITKQPQEVSIKAGEIFNYTIEASGNGLKYDWQYQWPNQTKWTSWNRGKTKTLSETMKSSWNNMKIRCVITDSNNNSVTSDEVLLKLNK